MEVGIDFEGLLEGGDRFVDPPGMEKSDAEIAAENSMRGHVLE